MMSDSSPTDPHPHHSPLSPESVSVIPVVTSSLRARVKYKYTAVDHNQVSIDVGDIVIIHNQPNEDWWDAELNGERGYIPAKYVEIITSQNQFQIPEYDQDEEDDEEEENPILSAHHPKSHLPHAASSSSSSPPASSTPADNAMQSSLLANEHFSSSSHPSYLSQASNWWQSQFQPDPTSNNAHTLLVINRTNYGLLSSNLSLHSVPINFMTSITAIIMGAENSELYGSKYIGIGVIALLYAIAISVWEYRIGRRQRSPIKLPLRFLAYIIPSLPLFFTYPTSISATLYLIIALLNLLAFYNSESLTSVQWRSLQQINEEEDDIGMWNQMKRWYLATGQEGKGRRATILVVYGAICLIGGFVSWSESVSNIDGREDDEADHRKTSHWAAIGDGFGFLIQYHSALLLFPMLKSLLALAHNYIYTVQNGCLPGLFRLISLCFPIEKNALLHKFFVNGFVIAVWFHSISHLISFAVSSDASLAYYSSWVYLTGGIMLVLLSILLSTSTAHIKLGHYDLFYRSHHLFLFLYLFMLLHGRHYISRSFWKWILIPALLYTIERGFRYRAIHRNLVLLSVTQIRPNTVCMELRKPFEWKEGQSVLMQVPAVSGVEWQQVIITSAPQSETMTLHLRLQGSSASWSRQVSDFVASMGPVGASHYELSRVEPNGQHAGRILSPKGNPILLLHSPSSSPSQFITSYTTSILILSSSCAPILSSTFQSIVFHRWKYSLFPEHFICHWILKYSDIDTYRWLLTYICECQDEMNSMRKRVGNSVGIDAEKVRSRVVLIHIHLVDVPENEFSHVLVSGPGGQQQKKPVEIGEGDEFWGRSIRYDFSSPVGGGGGGGNVESKQEVEAGDSEEEGDEQKQSDERSITINDDQMSVRTSRNSRSSINRSSRVSGSINLNKQNDANSCVRQTSYTRADLYRCVKRPNAGMSELGDVRITVGAPNWHDRLDEVLVRATQERNEVGVMYAGEWKDEQGQLTEVVEQHNRKRPAGSKKVNLIKQYFPNHQS